MNIDNTSNRQIQRSFFESEENIQDEKTRTAFLNIFDRLDSEENDNQAGVITTQENIQKLLKELASHFIGNCTELFDKWDVRNDDGDVQIQRSSIESEKDIQDEKCRDFILNVFDKLDEEENDNQAGILTTLENRQKLYDEFRSYANKNWMKLFDKLGIENIREDSDTAEIDRDTFSPGTDWETISKITFINDSFAHKILMSKIIEKFDNGDGKAQDCEAKLLRFLLNKANSLVENSEEQLDKNHISLKGLTLLLQKIEDGSIDIDKIREDIKSGNTLSYDYPQAEDITQSLNINPKSKYNVKIFKTNATEKYDGVGDGSSSIEYNTYIISFIDPETNDIQNINVNLDKLFSIQTINKFLKQISEESSTNLADLMSNELNDLYITSRRNNTGRSENYGRVVVSFKSGGFYQKWDESVNLYSHWAGLAEWNNLDLETLFHELGHAKDNDLNVKYQLYKLIEKDEIKQQGDYFLASPEELYAEFFEDYIVVQEKVSKIINKKYSNILSQLPDNARQKFIEEASVSILTNQNTTISTILDKAELSDYKELFGDKINSILDTRLKNAELKHHIKAMAKFGKTDPEVTDLYIQLIREIAYDYNNPKERVNKRFGI